MLIIYLKVSLQTPGKYCLPASSYHPKRLHNFQPSSSSGISSGCYSRTWIGKSKIWLHQAAHFTDKLSFLRTWHCVLSFSKHSRRQTKALFSSLIHVLAGQNFCWRLCLRGLMCLQGYRVKKRKKKPQVHASCFLPGKDNEVSVFLITKPLRLTLHLTQGSLSQAAVLGQVIRAHQPSLPTTPIASLQGTHKPQCQALNTWMWIFLIARWERKKVREEDLAGSPMQLKDNTKLPFSSDHRQKTDPQKWPLFITPPPESVFLMLSSAQRPPWFVVLTEEIKSDWNLNQTKRGHEMEGMTRWWREKKDKMRMKSKRKMWKRIRGHASNI